MLDHGRIPRSNLRFVPLFTLVVMVLAASLAASCSAVGPTSSTSTTSSSTGGGGGAGGDGSGGNLIPDGELAITPNNPILILDLPVTQTVPFSCIDTATQMPVDATWTLSTYDLGTISTDGVFTPNGKQTGDVTVECSNGDATASTTLKVVLHVVEGDDTLTQGEIDILKGPPGSGDAGWSFLYPYDETVFPRGILPPEIHLSSGNAPGDTYYVHIIVPNYEYEGFFKAPATQTQLQMSQEAWDALGLTAAGQKVIVHVSKLSGGVKYGPITRKWILAKGKLHGVIHYESYDTQIASFPGAILRIKGNSATPEVLLDNCNVCHSVAADGSTIATAQGTFDLGGGMLNPPQLTANDASFAAVFPKQGSVALRWYLGSAGLWTKAGTQIPESGIEPYLVRGASFSIDGTKLAFWENAFNGTSGLLSMLDYDELTQKFTNYQILANIPNQPVTTWPAFTPDGKAVVFQAGTIEMTAGGTGRLLAVDAVTKQLTDLAKLNGDGYVPAGLRDENKNYEPTIAPLASGGYFWITFTSRRTYGNQLTGPEETTKRLWIAAYDLNAQPGVDPSHPAFYVAGQELNAGNSRGFWSLDACKPEGATCETGDECCEGGCIPVEGSTEKVCGTPQGCSNEFDSCETTADCCDTGLVCIGGKCALEVPD
jgi:hypothetical protein